MKSFPRHTFCIIFIFAFGLLFSIEAFGQKLTLDDLIEIERLDFSAVKIMMEENGFNHLDTEDKFSCTSILWAFRDSANCAEDPPLLEKAICMADVSSVHYYVKNHPLDLEEAAEALEMNLITTIEISESSTGYKYQNEIYRLLYIHTKEENGEEGCELKLTKR